MKINDSEMKTALESGKYIRRASWGESSAVYRLACGALEFGYYCGGKFIELDDEDSCKYTIEYDDIWADDWEIKA